MKYGFLFPGKVRPAALSAGVDLYLDRMKKMNNVTVELYRDERIDSRPAALIKAAEGKRLLQSIKDDDFLIACDEHGKALNTLTLAEQIKTADQGMGAFSGKKRVIFTIGGALGLDEVVLNRANLSLKLSSLTLAGAVARLMLCEAVYRAFTVAKGHPYHNE